MQEYPDSQEHFDRFIKDSVDTYITGLEERGLEPNPILTRAWADRAVRAAAEDYHQKNNKVWINNIEFIKRRHAQRDLDIRRQGAKLAFLTCPPIACVFALIAVASFTHENWHMGFIYTTGALAFMVMLCMSILSSRK